MPRTAAVLETFLQKQAQAGGPDARRGMGEWAPSQYSPCSFSFPAAQRTSVSEQYRAAQSAAEAVKLLSAKIWIL